MLKHMKLLGVAGAILLVFAGAAVASNMGFKFTANIATGDPDVYLVSIPLNNNYTTIKSIFDDINASSGCSASQVTIFHPDQSTDSWTGPGSPSNPTVGVGEGVLVSTSGSCTGWIIVGSHNPNFQYSFPTADPDIYMASVPYHTTRTSIKQLFEEIPNAAQVTKMNPDQSTCSWTGPGSPDNCAITIGDAYFISVSAASLWTPSHY